MNPNDLIGSSVIHSMGSIQYANEQFCDLVDVGFPDELKGEPIDEFIAPSYQAPLRNALKRIDNNEADTLGLRTKLTPRNSRERNAIAVSSRVRWEGSPQTRTTFIQVSKKDENGSLSLQETALHEAPIGITIADVTLEDEPLIYVNDGFVELTKYPREEIIGQNCRFLQGEKTRQESADKMRAAIEANQSVTAEVRNYRKDGSLFWNRVTLSPIENDTGEVTHYFGFQENISEQKTHEEERFLFETYAETADSMMFITDSDSTIEYVNPAFERTTGYSAAEAVGQTPQILKSDKNGKKSYEDLWDSITLGESWEGQVTNQKKSGELYEATLRITPIANENGDIQHYVASEREITGKQVRQQVLDVLNRVLRHNVRNSVMAIDGYAEFIESNPTDTEVGAMATTIRDYTDTLKEIAEKTATIRTLVGLIDGREASDPMPLANIESIIDQYRQRYPDAAIESDIADNETLQIRYGAVFNIVIEELLENAIEHNDQTTPQIEVAATNTLEANKATVKIADNGPGIPKAEWEVIKSGQETQLNHTQAVGLWVVYWAITALGGTVELTENDPRGSIVTLRVPLV